MGSVQVFVRISLVVFAFPCGVICLIMPTPLHEWKSLIPGAVPFFIIPYCDKLITQSCSPEIEGVITRGLSFLRLIRCVPFYLKESKHIPSMAIVLFEIIILYSLWARLKVMSKIYLTDVSKRSQIEHITKQLY